MKEIYFTSINVIKKKEKFRWILIKFYSNMISKPTFPLMALVILIITKTQPSKYTIIFQKIKTTIRHISSVNNKSLLMIKLKIRLHLDQ